MEIQENISFLAISRNIICLIEPPHLPKNLQSFVFHPILLSDMPLVCGGNVISEGQTSPSSLYVFSAVLRNSGKAFHGHDNPYMHYIQGKLRYGLHVKPSSVSIFFLNAEERQKKMGTVESEGSGVTGGISCALSCTHCPVSP